MRVDQRLKLKEGENLDKYSGIARDLKKQQLWNIVTVPKNREQRPSELEKRERNETILIFQKSTWIFRRIQET